jgi:hypothetical protein
MKRPTTYKKHMKHATDLFWLPRDSSDSGIHWTFDESYSVVKRQECSRDAIDDAIHSRFSICDDDALPVPILGSESTGDTYSMNFGERRESSSHHRAFLPFPDGFWSNVYSSESHAPKINPVSAW